MVGHNDLSHPFAPSACCVIKTMLKHESESLLDLLVSPLPLLKICMLMMLAGHGRGASEVVN